MLIVCDVFDDDDDTRDDAVGHEHDCGAHVQYYVECDDDYDDDHHHHDAHHAEVDGHNDGDDSLLNYTIQVAAKNCLFCGWSEFGANGFMS